VGDVLDVDAAGGDVGGDEDVDLAIAEGAQRLLAGALAEVAVDGGRREAALGEVVGDLGGGALGAAEDDRQAAVRGLQDAREHLGLVHRVRAVDELLDRLDRLAVVAVLVHGPDVRRLGHVAARQRHDGARHGRREEHRLAAGGVSARIFSTSGRKPRSSISSASSSTTIRACPGPGGPAWPGR
jgi:hypothetical protein